MAKTRAIRIHRHGGPEALVWESIELPDPGPGEVRLRQEAVGLNYIDTYHRTGLYPVPELPAVLGREGAGVVEAVGPNVAGLQPGDRVAYPMSAGAYAERRNIAAADLVRLPDGIEPDVAAALMLKGLTAQYLLRRTHRVREGETILIHAAAGGVGLLMCQWAAHLGATVIGTVGSAEKAALAREHGCRHTVLYREEDFVARVRELTEGRGVPVVYDSVGKATFAGSLDCLAPLGLMVSFGNASGAVEPFAIGQLAVKGSLYLTRPTLATYIADRSMMAESASELFDLVRAGRVTARIGQTFPLAETARAHRELEGRQTSGATVLLP